MMKIDRFLDTRKKRSCFFHIFYLLITCWIICTYLQTAFVLIGLKSYDQLFAALSNTSLSGSYMARVVLLGMSMSEFNLIHIISILCKALRMMDILWLLMSALIIFSDIFRDVRKRYCLPCLLYILQFSFIGIIAWLATQATSLMMVIQYIGGIGWFIMLIQGVIVALCAIWMVKELKAYISALQYDAIEVE